MTDAPVRMLTEDVRDRRAWRRESLSPRDWLVTLPPACLGELDAAVEKLRRDPFPTLLLTPDQFGLAGCAEAMADVRRRLRDIGLAVVGRVPVERYEPEENR